jgi:ABC-2 type transport system ATP-binding protein
MLIRLLPCLLGFFLILGGCTTTLPLAKPGDLEKPLKREYYQVKIKAHDGKLLAATVYQPALQPGDTAPLIIATHGFAGFRAERPWSIYGKTMLTGEAPLAAWKKGYWVVFYDQRGWGGSQGVVHLGDKKYDVEDVSDVITWALTHLPAIRKMPDGSPAIGMIGESQGAAIQMLASGVDPRIKTITPIASYYDLNDMAPNGQIKSNWGAIMLTMGGLSSGFDIGFMTEPPFSFSTYWHAVANDKIKHWFHEHSPSSYCDAGEYPHADALFIQGYRDSLFDMDQAVDNADCVRKGGHDARILAIQGGHILPWPVQKWSGKPFFNTDDNLYCGDYKTTIVQAVVDYWNEKLEGDAQKVPEYCINLDDHEGLQPDHFPLDNSSSFSIPRSWVWTPTAGLFEDFMIPADTIGDWFRDLWPGADLRGLSENGGFGRPRFIPVYIAHQDDALIGTPTINLRVGGVGKPSAMKLFVGVGVQHAGERRVHVASEHLTPLPGKGIYQQDLPSIAYPLKSGDRVGLVLYGFTWQYFWNAAWIWREAVVEGSMTLPLTHYDYKDTNFTGN